MSYINKDEAINIIKVLPVADFNGVEMCSKKRILKALEILPSTDITTKLRRNKYSQIYCQNCENIFNVSAMEAIHLESCPICGLKIVECKFDN